MEALRSGVMSVILEQSFGVDNECKLATRSDSRFMAGRRQRTYLPDSDELPT